MEHIKTLAETSPLWLPGLSYLTARVGASQPGRRIEAALKERLGLLRDTATERAFQEAFAEGARRYERERGDTPAGQAVIRVLRRVAEGRETSDLDQARVLAQVFAPQPDLAELTDVVRRYAFAIEGLKVSPEAVGAALAELVADFLRPAFLAQPQFTERVGLARIIGLLQELLDAQRPPPADLGQLRADYLAQQRELYRNITMHGISPKVGGRTIGIAMEDVFVPLRGKLEIDELMSTLSNLRKKSLDEASSAPVESDTRAEYTNDVLLKTDSIARWVESNKDSLIPSRSWEPAEIARSSAHILLEGFLKQHGLEKLLHAGDINLFDLQELRHVLICGDPGSGKSTLTRYITWSIAAGKAELIGEQLGDYLPIRIRAIEFGEALERGQVDTLEEYLIEQAGRFAPLVKQALLLDRALVLIDGLDEIGERALRLRVKERVDAFAADPLFADNRMVITTRIVGYERSGVTGRFPHFTIAELSDEQIGTFVAGWYRAIQAQLPGAIEAERERAQLLAAVTSSASIKRMARNPLLLTIIALMKWQGRALPEQRVLLYDVMTQTLVRSWPETHRAVRLDDTFIREWLAPVAHLMFAGRTADTIDEYSLLEALVASMRELRSLTPLEARQASAALLESIAEHSGLILPRGTDADGHNLYGFLHQTFAEYLTAFHLINRWQSDELDLRQYAHDPYWREVLLLMAGHLGTQHRKQAGTFVQAIRDLRSSPYEDTIHRDLLLACRVLGDGVPVGPGERVERLLRELFDVWRDTPIAALRQDIQQVLKRLAPTEYGAVFVRIARAQPLDARALIDLAKVFGPGQLDDALAAHLTAEDFQVRLDAARVLAGHNDMRGLECLGELLELEPSHSGSYALSELRKRTDLAAVRSLHALLEHTNTEIRLRVATLLAKSGVARAKEIIAELASKGDPQLRYSAALALCDFDLRSGLDALASLDDKIDARMYIDIARRLEKHKDVRFLKIYTELLDSKEPIYRTEAASRLAKHGDSRGVDMLVQWCADRNPLLRFFAAISLADMEHPLGIATLVALQRTKNLSVRCFAARELIEHGDQRGRKTLLTLLEHDAIEVRRDAAEELRMLEHRDAPGTQEAFDLAIRALADDRDWLDDLWEKIQNHDQGVPSDDTLELLARSPYKQVAVRFAELLMESDPARATPILIDLAGSRSFEVHLRAAGLLAGRGHAASIAFLADLLDDEEEEVGWSAAVYLADASDQRGIDALAALLRSPDDVVRTSAAGELFDPDQPRHNEQESAAVQELRRRKRARFAEHVDHLLADVQQPFEMLTLDGRDWRLPSHSCADRAYEFLSRFLTPQGEIDVSL